MKTLRIASAVAIAVIGGLLATSAPAQANAVQPFRADSGDNCRYGFTQGYLNWRYTTIAPIRPVFVDVRGTVTDRPVPTDPSFACRDDRYYSVASFTAYLGNGTVARQEAKANNQAVSFSFTLGSNTTGPGLSRLIVQVCRYPLYTTQPPSPGYCGLPQHYAPVVYDPPPPGAAA